MCAASPGAARSPAAPAGARRGVPEAGFFRGWYTTKAAERANEYLAQLGRECQVEVIDAREWIDDDMQFVDGHHLRVPGADQFTRRFQREAIAPALASLARPAGSMVSRRADAPAK